jgi:hypothetical protein
VDSRSITDDGSLCEMLSLDRTALNDDGSCNEFRTPLKPSMQRSMNVRNQIGEIDAADERIRNRLQQRSEKKKKW